jgi:hypothetical protein
MFSYRACIYDQNGRLASSRVSTRVMSRGGHLMYWTSYANNGAIGGLAGADAACQWAADGSHRPGTWRALLSTSAVNARDHVRIAGPTYNLENVMIALNDDDLWDGGLAVAVTDSESGEQYAYVNNNNNITNGVWTGSTQDGLRMYAETCSDWTTTSGNGRNGNPAATNNGWQEAGSQGCNGYYSLLCVSQPDPVYGQDLTGFTAVKGTNSAEVDLTISLPASRSEYARIDIRRQAGRAIPQNTCADSSDTVVTSLTGPFGGTETYVDTTPTAGGIYGYRVCAYDSGNHLISSLSEAYVVSKDGHEIFATAATYTLGALGSVGQADTYCQNTATQVGLPGTWLALLSSSGVPANVHVNITGPVYNTRGFLIATNSADFWDGSLNASVDYSESRLLHGSFDSAATGSLSDGTAAAATCSDWTSSGSTYEYGLIRSVNSAWLQNNTASCVAASLYCISQ